MIVNISNVNHSISDEVVCFTNNNNLICKFKQNSIIYRRGDSIVYNSDYVFSDNSRYKIVRKKGWKTDIPRIYLDDIEIGEYKYTYKLRFLEKEYKFYIYYKSKIVYIIVYLGETLVGEIVKNNGQNVSNNIYDYTVYFENKENLRPLIFRTNLFHEQVYRNFGIDLQPRKIAFNISNKGKKMLDLSYIERIKSMNKIID